MRDSRLSFGSGAKKRAGHAHDRHALFENERIIGMCEWTAAFIGLSPSHSDRSCGLIFACREG
jgi:hypothetical protein